ncbi:Hpt domain-containing protein [Aquabacterium sp. OR-4]|uniref:Hpt domain-containing protein n=1 Tax=Aquabacterium sp. OR-4 TaxID=2978127 RepID=UPI0021B17CB2|nr:Hpt domain-containing protein [Aquabacterium sp. OR-4]MDT7836180.1 Hpt domain-containing protein [Aquabacterium sp. OR-4]
MSHDPTDPTSSAAATADAAADAAGGPLDARTLAQLHQLDPSGANRLMARVLTAYSESLARLRGQIVAARAAGDAAITRLAVHTLKSSSASIGALRLSVLCAEAEQAIRDGQSHDVGTVLDRLEVEAVRVDAAVQHLLTQHR